MSASTSSAAIAVHPEDEPQETHAQNLAVLADYRAKHVRASEEVVQRGERVLSIKNALRKMGEDG
jgi:hypothetical protein